MALRGEVNISDACKSAPRAAHDNTTAAEPVPAECPICFDEMPAEGIFVIGKHLAHLHTASWLEVLCFCMQCYCCLHALPLHVVELSTLGSIPWPSCAAGSCLHRFCRGCLRRHVQSALQGRTFPVVCPLPECRTALDAGECEQLLAECPSDVERYREVGCTCTDSPA